MSDSSFPGAGTSRRIELPRALVWFAAGLVVGAVAALGPDAWAGAKNEDLQKTLPAGVVRLSLARLHARTLALHHNEFQRRGQNLTFVYLPEVTTVGVRAKVWVGRLPDARGVEAVEKELQRLAEAMVSEARLAAGVEFNLKTDVRFDVTVQGLDTPWTFEGHRLKR